MTFHEVVFTLIYDFMCLGDSPSCKVQVSQALPSRADWRQQISGK